METEHEVSGVGQGVGKVDWIQVQVQVLAPTNVSVLTSDHWSCPKVSLSLQKPIDEPSLMVITYRWWWWQGVAMT